MADIQHNARLNSFVVSIGRSLLQYAHECWPWFGLAEGELQSLLQRLAALQRQEVAALVELLDQRNRTIDFGSYPTEYTDLHFLSLDFFLTHIIAGERAIIADLDEAAHACVDDSQATDALREVLATERQILARLEAAVASRKQLAPTS